MSEITRSRTDIDEEFYVGYLPTPSRLRKTLACVTVLFLLGVVSAGAMIAVSQRDPGAATWDVDQTHTLTGTLAAEPYPMILTDAGRAILLTGPTKQGAAAWAKGLVGVRVDVKGNPLRRGEFRMLSLADEETPIRPAAHVPPVSTPAPGSRDRDSDEMVTLAGEIVDSKCYTGAMKPGDGKTHKGCAALCLRGGIPPVLVSNGPDGRARLTLLAGADGGPLTGVSLDRAIALVGEPITITGKRRRVADLDILRVADGGIGE